MTLPVAPAHTEGSRGRTSLALVFAAAAPAVVATLLVALFVVSELSGHTPFSYELPLNIAEAAAMGSGTEVLRRLRQGENPGAVLDVRPRLISSSITRVTTVEAAVWGRRVELVRLLEREGAIEGDSARQYVACLATIARVPSIVQEFAPTGVVGCEAKRVIRRLEARSQ